MLVFFFPSFHYSKLLFFAASGYLLGLSSHEIGTARSGRHAEQRLVVRLGENVSSSVKTMNTGL